MAQSEIISRHLWAEMLPACCCIQTPPRCNAVHSGTPFASAPSLSGVKLETTPSGKPNCRAGPLLSAPATLMCIPMPDRVIEFQRPVRTLEDLLNSIQEPEPDPEVCPQCSSNHFVPITYGYPTEETEQAARAGAARPLTAPASRRPFHTAAGQPFFSRAGSTREGWKPEEGPPPPCSLLYAKTGHRDWNRRGERLSRRPTATARLLAVLCQAL